MSDEKRDVLDRLSGWGLDRLKQMVTAGREAADAGIWGMSINAAKGEDANRISAAYSALWANAPLLLEIVEELAQEVREWRGKPAAVDYQDTIANLRAALAAAEDDAVKWQHRAREYQLDANAHKSNFNAELEGNKKLREEFGARENETWRQWLGRMASEAAEAQKRAAKWEREAVTQKALADGWKRECLQERDRTARLAERLDAIKKAVSDE